MTSPLQQKWIDIAKALTADPNATARCPACEKSDLEVFDTHVSGYEGVYERRVWCEGCGARTAILKPQGPPRTKRSIKVMADYGASPLWLQNAGMETGNIDVAAVGVCEPLASELTAWAAEYTATLNMDDPRESGFRDRETELAFVARGRELADKLAKELGADTKVTFFHAGDAGTFDRGGARASLRTNESRTQPQSRLPSLVERTNQQWKVNLERSALWVGGACVFGPLIVLGERLKAEPAFFILILGGLLFGIGSFVFGCVSIRCPTCGLRWFWMAVSSNAPMSWEVWLNELDACPACGYTGEKKNMTSEVVTPENFTARIAPHMAALTHCYGAIVMLKAGGDSESKGSMVLVRTSAGHFVFTARHVAEEVRAKGGYIFIRPAVTEEQAMHGHFTGVVRFELSAADIAWASDEMDVAAFQAPEAFVALPYLRWFDAAASTTAARSVRRQCGGEHPLPTVIMGCPNFGHFKDDKLETLSFLPMLTYISSMNAPWDGLSKVPQIHLEIDDGSQREQPPQEGFRLRIWESLRSMAASEKEVAFGGYSGGPLVVIGNDGEFLIGVITEGSYVFGSARMTVVAWDDIMVAFERDMPPRAA